MPNCTKCLQKCDASTVAHWTNTKAYVVMDKGQLFDPPREKDGDGKPNDHHGLCCDCYDRRLGRLEYI